MMIYIGVDPGLSGAIAVIFNPKGGPDMTTMNTMPIIPAKTKKNKKTGKTKTLGRKQYDVQAIYRMFCDLHTKYDAFATIEEFRGFPPSRANLSSIAAQKRIIGFFEGLCVGLQMKYALVSPQQWQKQLLAGTPGEDAKQKSMIVATRIFPEAELRTPRGKLDENKCDAILIAKYGMMNY